jgi:hypothetical protein
MDLEQRVQMLEQELQILKSQIQATLLDIQEQLLTNAYPALRASAPPQKSTAPAAETPSPTTRRVAKAEIINDNEEDDEDDGPALPSIVKRVTLDGIEPPAAKSPSIKANKTGRVTNSSDDDNQPRPATRARAVYQPTDAEDEDDNDDYGEAPASPSRSSKSLTLPAKPGKDAKNTKNARAALPEPDEAPESSVDEEDLAIFGRFGSPKARPSTKPDGRPNTVPPARSSARPPAKVEAQPDEWSEIWPEIWPDDDDTSPKWPPKLAVPDPVVSAPPTTSLTLSSGPDWTSLNRLAEWVGNKVKDIGIDATKDIIELNAQRGTFSPEVKAALTQLVALYDEDGALNTGKIDAALEGLNKPPEIDPEDSRALQQSETSRLILRLIAGVQNAGAGIPRKKK